MVWGHYFAVLSLFLAPGVQIQSFIFSPKFLCYGQLWAISSKTLYSFRENLPPNRPNYFLDFPIIGPKKKVVVNFIYGYQNLSGEKCKTNEERISSIGLTSLEKNPKNYPKCHFSEKQCFRLSHYLWPASPPLPWWWPAWAQPSTSFSRWGSYRQQQHHLAWLCPSNVSVLQQSSHLQYCCKGNFPASTTEKVKVYIHKIVWHYKSWEWFLQILQLLNKLKCSKKWKCLTL